MSSLRYVIGLALIGAVFGHSYSTGDCPEVAGMPNFSIEKFLGQWYVIQKTSSSSKCLVNNYTRDDTGTLRFDQISRHAVLGATSDDGRYHYTGSLEHREGAPSAADMLVRFKFNFLGAASYVVVETDYTNWAAVASCQKLPVGHRFSANILSRTSVLKPEFLEKARGVLSAAKVEVSELSDLVQTGEECDQSPSPVRSFVDSAGATISKAADAVKDGAKKLYEKVRGGDSSESRESTEDIKKLNPAAEWLP